MGQIEVILPILAPKTGKFEQAGPGYGRWFASGQSDASEGGNDSSLFGTVADVAGKVWALPNTDARSLSSKISRG